MKNLRLEWVEAGTLMENPANWRRHSPEQLQSIKDLLADPEVGWAGAFLFNEKTGRLIDGHARKTVVDPKEVVPVLVGSWSEEAEKKILATLDPVGAMATGDPAAYQALVESITAESLWVRDLLHNTAAGLVATDEEADPEEEPSAALPQMECQPFEHHDYLMLMFKNEQDFQQACERLGIQKVAIMYPGGKSKVGLGRVIDGAKALRMLTEAPGSAPLTVQSKVVYANQQPKPQGNGASRDEAPDRVDSPEPANQPRQCHTDNKPGRGKQDEVG